jgi:hypothetical protein
MERSPQVLDAHGAKLACFTQFKKPKDALEHLLIRKKP